MAFHDAIAYSTNGFGGGGADGSILVFNVVEGTYPNNMALIGLAPELQQIAANNNITDGDL